MKILKKVWQFRRDFRATMECEYCGAIEENVRGYDDRYFHEEVIPKMVCKRCGKHSDGPTSSPDVPEGVVL